MLGSNLQTYQHSRWGLKWIRNSSCCMSERSGPRDPPRGKKNIIRQACCKHTSPIYHHCLCVCVCFLGMDVGERRTSEKQRLCKCMYMNVLLTVVSLCVVRGHLLTFVSECGYGWKRFEFDLSANGKSLKQVRFKEVKESRGINQSNQGISLCFSC